MAAKPPKGFVAFGSKKGGYRKRAPNGGFIYWYPDGKGGKGRVTGQKHKADVGARDALMTMIEAALPPDKQAMVVKLSELLDKEDQPDTTDEPSGEQPSSDAGEAQGAQVAETMAAYAPPAELAELHGEAAEARRRAQTEVERHRLEQERQRMQAVAEALAELAPGISDEEVAKIKAAVGAKFGQLDGGSTDPAVILDAIRDVTRDPELYGVLPEQRKALEAVDRIMSSLDTGELPERGFEITDTDSPVGRALGVAAAGVKLVTSGVKLFRAAVGTQNEAAATAFLRATVGAAYTMAALGAAAAIGQIAPQHPIARHAQDYGQQVDAMYADVGAIERAHRRVDYVVRTMGDQDMDQSLSIISDKLMRLGVMKPPPRIPRNVLESSLGMHRALQGLQDAIQGREVGVSERESNLRRAYSDLVGELLWKARATKYCRREPTGNPKRPWRYYYGDECGTAAARALKQGDIIRVGTARVRVASVDAEGTVTLEPVDEKMDSEIFGRDPLVFKATEWSELMRKHFGSAFQRSADRRARQAVNAVLRYVPASMLAELEGETEAERLENLKVRAPEIYNRLQLSIRRSGVDLVTARTYIADALMAQGWDGEARAALLGNLLDERNAWLAKNYRRVIRATNNARTGDGNVTAREVQAAVDILRPGGPAANIDKLTEAVKPDVAELRKALDALRGSPDVDAARDILEKMLGNPALAQMMAVTQALPETATETSDTVRDMTAELQAATPRGPSKQGAATTVYVAGKDGAPVALPGRYVLMEAADAIPSHNSTTFAPRKDYPDGLQERQYHRDRNEQMKVIRNAQRMAPGFVINTNPDALNGPPISNAAGHVLGGNSRTMSIQRIYEFHPDKAQEYRQYLRDNAYQAGFTEADLEGIENPILMRVVDTEGQDDNLLVRQMNESFIQAMDPRTMQVAMGRRLTKGNLDELAGTMEADETLRAYLDSSRAKGFIATLGTAGIIDNRNRSQYVRKNGKLNEDGKQLVERILVGHVIPDPDVLSGARARTIGAVARSVPYMVQAEGASPRYDIRQNLRDALDGHIRMHDMGFQPARGASKRERDEAVANTRAQMTDMFTGDHPVLADERTGMLFDVLVQHDGPVKMAKIFKEYANQASANPEGQQTLMGPPPTATDILRQSIRAVEQREQRDATPAGGLFRAARERLDLLKSKDAKKTPAEPHERRKGSAKNKRGSAATGSGSIELSESTIETLRNKVKEHNESSEKTVTLGQLKAVYRRGAGAFSTSHHPRANRHSWSMGRVNSFLRRVKGGKGHSQDDDLIRKATSFADLIKRLQRPPGRGWGRIPKPRGGRLGWRRPDGKGGYEYRYDDELGQLGQLDLFSRRKPDPVMAHREHVQTVKEKSAQILYGQSNYHENVALRRVNDFVFKEGFRDVFSSDVSQQARVTFRDKDVLSGLRFAAKRTPEYAAWIRRFRDLCRENPRVRDKGEGLTYGDRVRVHRELFEAWPRVLEVFERDVLPGLFPQREDQQAYVKEALAESLSVAREPKMFEDIWPTDVSWDNDARSLRTDEDLPDADDRKYAPEPYVLMGLVEAEETFEEYSTPPLDKELELHVWGRADQYNNTARAMCLLGDKGRYRPHTLDMELEKVDVDRYGTLPKIILEEAWQRYNYAQARIGTYSREEWPNAYRGLVLEADVVRQIKPGDRIPLTGCTAYSFSRSVAGSYAAAEITVRASGAVSPKPDGADTGVKVLMQVERDDVFDASIAAMNNRRSAADRDDAPVYEVVSGGNAFVVTSISEPQPTDYDLQGGVVIKGKVVWDE